MKTLCVYCASSDRLDAKYHAAATRVGEEIARRQWALVYGGGKTGLMGAVARAVKLGGGKVVGVIPDFMKARELEFTEADEARLRVMGRERETRKGPEGPIVRPLPGGSEGARAL